MSELEPAQRVQLYLEITYKTNYGRNEQKAVLKNISLTGGFLETNVTQLRVQDKIKIFFVVADREREIKSEVVWLSAEGAGVRFLPKNNQDHQIIDDLIYFVETRQVGYKGYFDK